MNIRSKPWQKQGYMNKLKNWFLDLTKNSAGSLKTFLYFPVLRYKKNIYPVKGSMSASMLLIEQDASMCFHQSPINKVLQNTDFYEPESDILAKPGIFVKYFLSLSQKNLSPEKTETN